jgi:hypothetical protein
MMKNLLLLLLAFPSLICADLAFPAPYQKFTQRDYAGALKNYNAILTYRKDLTDLERLEATFGRGMSAMCIYEADSQESNRLMKKCIADDEEKTMNMAVWFLGLLRD